MQNFGFGSKPRPYQVEVPITIVKQVAGQEVTVQETRIEQRQRLVNVPQIVAHTYLIPADRVKTYRMSGQQLSRQEQESLFDKPQPVLFVPPGEKLDPWYRSVIRDDIPVVTATGTDPLAQGELPSKFSLPTRPISFSQCRLDANGDVLSLQSTPVLESVVEQYTVQTPVIEVRDGRQVVRFVPEQRMRKRTVTRLALEQVVIPAERIHAQRADRQPVAEDKLLDLLSTAQHAVMLHQGQLDDWYRKLLKDDTLVISGR